MVQPARPHNRAGHSSTPIPSTLTQNDAPYLHFHPPAFCLDDAALGCPTRPPAPPPPCLQAGGQMRSTGEPAATCCSILRHICPSVSYLVLLAVHLHIPRPCGLPHIRHHHHCCAASAHQLPGPSPPTNRQGRTAAAPPNCCTARGGLRRRAGTPPGWLWRVGVAAAGTALRGVLRTTRHYYQQSLSLAWHALMKPEPDSATGKAKKGCQVPTCQRVVLVKHAAAEASRRQRVPVHPPYVWH